MNISLVSARKGRKGFTLIELLVVIAIIAILASILFPVFGRARENARRSSCQSQMKQTGLAFMQYSQDYDETLPMGRGQVHHINPAGTQVAWDALIEPYMQKGTTQFGQGNNPMMKCPSDGIEPLTSAGVLATQWVGGPARNKRSYAIPLSNIVLGADPDYAWKKEDNCGGPGFDCNGRKLSEFPSTATTFLMVESPNALNHIGVTGGYRVAFVRNDGLGNTNYDQAQLGSSAVTVANSNLTVMGRTGQHFDGFNYLYADGHVKFLRPMQTLGVSQAAPGANDNGYQCLATPQRPCGPWTISDDD